MKNTKIQAFANIPLAVIYEEPPALERTVSMEVTAPQSPRQECVEADWDADRLARCAAAMGMTPDALTQLQAIMAPSRAAKQVQQK